jgi:hypothetical protein
MSSATQEEISQAIRAKTKGRPATGRPSFQGRIVPTEVQNAIRTFWKKSYEALKGSVKEFFQNKCFCFQQFTIYVNIPREVTKNVTPEFSTPVTLVFSWTYRPTSG